VNILYFAVQNYSKMMKKAKASARFWHKCATNKEIMSIFANE